MTDYDPNQVEHGRVNPLMPAEPGRYPEIKFDTHGYSYITVEHLRELVHYLDQHGVPDDTPLVTRPKGFKGKLRSIGVEGNL